MSVNSYPRVYISKFMFHGSVHSLTHLVTFPLGDQGVMSLCASFLYPEDTHNEHLGKLPGLY